MMAVTLALGATLAAAAPPTIGGPAGTQGLAPARRLTPPGPSVGGCSVFPGTNAWNTDVSGFPLHPRSATTIAKIQSVGGDFLHPDFGSNPDYGIPYVVVPPTQPLVPITYTAYGDESDPGPFPVPLDAPVEGGAGSTGDRHVLVVQEGSCELFELYVARRSGAGWSADSGARWNLVTGDLRPIGWTSADAAGLPILPGLVRFDEVAAGSVRHAIRVTFAQTQRGFVLPATHFASSRTDPDLPPMGLRLRLRADYDLSAMTGQARVIAEAMKTYGLLVADNGSNWFFQGAPDPRWDDDDLGQLKQIPGTAFEVVDTGPVRTS
ncbi:MAG: hypothetical protein NTZ21_07815 [Actinobacteria bacterium]|nr:hypothetical protein [Actinomycetota bacterium]